MSSPLHTSEGNRASYRGAPAAGADEAVAHGRAHLDYQRRIATASVHGANRAAVIHEGPFPHLDGFNAAVAAGVAAHRERKGTT